MGIFERFLGEDKSPIDKISEIQESLVPVKEVTAEEIHADFDAAQERLLQEAMKVLAQPTEIERVHNKYQDMLKAGFTRSGFMEKARQKIGEFKLNGAVAAIIEHHKRTYPFHKFLTVAELNTLCKKYELVYAPTNSFIGDVPQKNLDDIKNAPELLKSDMASDEYHIKKIRESDEMAFKDFLIAIGRDPFDEESYIFTKAEHDAIELEARKLLNPYGELASYARKAYDEKGELPSQWRQPMGWGMDDHMAFHQWKEYHGVSFSFSEVEKISRKGLFIAAPKKDFDLSNLDMDGEFGYAMKEKIVVKDDPIVFRYVNGGVQILTKWGKEALDPLLANPLDN